MPGSAAAGRGHLAVDGPAVVAVGGGHGLAASLRAVRTYASSVVAVVSVADDGGSSGRLREANPGLPAPGDVRRCLAALADPASALGRTLEHRFEGGALDGHAFGNLLLAVLTEELGSFGAAVDEVAEHVGSVGRVLPATTGPLLLEGVCEPPMPGRSGAFGREERVVGQVAVQNATGLAHLRIHPHDPASPDDVTTAILGAQQVIIGPGSLFTSVLAAAIVPAVREALAATEAQRVFVANLAPQVPETGGLSAADELDVLLDHGIAVDVVVADPTRPCGGSHPSVPCIEAPVADDRGGVHHPGRLAAVLASLARDA